MGAAAMINFDDFFKIDIRVGRIIDVQPFPEARKPAWKLQIDFGSEIGVKKSSAQITDLYDADALMGRQILAVVNFPPRQIGPFMSEVLTLGVSNSDGAIMLVRPDDEVEEGSRKGLSPQAVKERSGNIQKASAYKLRKRWR